MIKFSAAAGGKQKQLLPRSIGTKAVNNFCDTTLFRHTNGDAPHDVQHDTSARITAGPRLPYSGFCIHAQKPFQFALVSPFPGSDTAAFPPSAALLGYGIPGYYSYSSVCLDTKLYHLAFGLSRGISKKSVMQTAADRAVRGKSDNALRSNKVKQKRSNSIALIAGIICIGLAIGGIGYFLHSFFLADLFSDTKEVEVPNFIGKYAESIDYSLYPDFDIYIEDWLPDDTVEQGYVISQDPKPDRMAKAGTQIALTVSSGTATDTMRDLVNQTSQNAKTILDNLALDIQVETIPESNDIVLKDCVFKFTSVSSYGNSSKQISTTGN